MSPLLKTHDLRACGLHTHPCVHHHLTVDEKPGIFKLFNLADYI